MFGQVLRQTQTSLLEEVAEGRYGFHQSAEETGSRALAVGTALTAVPNGDLVDTDSLDCFYLCLDEFGQFLQQKE